MTAATERALFQSVLADPDDDAPRLVYADWLEEHGDAPGRARAEFIRLQIERARLGKFDPGEVQRELRENWLRRRFGEGWQPDVPRELRYFNTHFRRGFIAVLELQPDEWLADPERWAAVTPVQGAWFRGVADARPLLASPALKRMRWLNLAAGRAGMRAMPHCRHLRNLEYLILGDERNLFDAQAAFLAETDLPALTGLELKFAGLTGEGVCQLVASPRLPKLHTLDIVYNRGVGLDGLRRLVALPEMTRMRSLNLQGACDGPESARILAESPNVESLRDLCLAYNYLGDEGLIALAGSPHLGHLGRLFLSSNGIGPTGVEALARSRLQGLTRLLLGTNPLGVEGCRAFRAGDALMELRGLDLSHCQLGDEGVRELVRWPGLASVRSLSLRGNELTAAAGRALADCPHLTNLMSLDLSMNGLRNDGIAALAGSPHLRALQHLDVSDNEIRLLGARALARSPHLASLRLLDLNLNPIGPDGARALAESPHLPDAPFFILEATRRTRIKDRAEALKQRWGDGFR